MPQRNLYLGFDTAKTMGVAFYDPKLHTSRVWEVSGTPLDQWNWVNTFDFNTIHVMIGMERLHVFLNAATVRSLAERYGYLKWSFMDEGFRVEEVGPGASRALWGFKKKLDAPQALNKLASPYKLTTNHADALLVALYIARHDGIDLTLEGLKIDVRPAVDYDKYRKQLERKLKNAR